MKNTSNSHTTSKGDKTLMLDKIGTQVVKHPYLIIIFTVLITIAFVVNIPGMKMNTSMADFMPDSEIANANSRITENFGKNQDVIMILTETDDSNMILSSDSIKELHSLSQKLGENEDIEGVMSFTTFIEMICQIEYNTSIEDSTDEHIHQTNEI